MNKIKVNADNAVVPAGLEGSIEVAEQGGVTPVHRIHTFATGVKMLDRTISCLDHLTAVEDQL